MMKAPDELEKKRKRKGKKRRHKKDQEGSTATSRRKSRKSILGKSRRFSVKRNTKIYTKKKEDDHLKKTIASWKLRWKNRTWRQKWKYLWGKSKWKPSIRKRWNTDKRWRRKYMKKIVKKWWDKKWRRKWMKRWIDNRWRTRWNRKRLRRKRLWQKRWRRSGAKKLGLTFNEFLITERRLKKLQTVRPEVVSRRRRERHFQKEKLIREKQEKREMFQNELKNMSFCNRWYNSIFKEEYYGPETFGIRPSVIQFKLYMLNAMQGLIPFFVVLYFHLTMQHSIPSEFTLQGLYTLVYFANAMDFYGSIFGMVTSHHLESYYERRTDVIRKKKKRGCFGFCKKKTVVVVAKGPEETDVTEKVDITSNPGSGSNIESQMKSSRGGGEASTSTRQDLEGARHRRRSKSRASGRRKSSATSLSYTRRRSHHHSSRHRTHHGQVLENGRFRKQPKGVNPSREGGSDSALPPDTIRLPKKKSKTKLKCNCRGLGFLYCSMVRKCFRPGRSREFINRMGYCSWILLQLAWFFNIIFTAYYNWLDIYYKDYQIANDRCKVYPRLKHCDEFYWLYFFLLAVVEITFALRNVLTFFIGMCFSERYLKRCKSADPNDEMATTCSDTDIDYSKVPRQILVPHILSGGKYPYVLPGHCRPVEYMLAKIQKVQEKNQKVHKMKEEATTKSGKNQGSKAKRKEKNKRRILSTYEREAAKVLAGFKQVRRTHIPLEKGKKKRKPWRIPVAAGVTDVQQLPPELMTTKAWAWLHDQSSSSEDENPNSMARNRHPIRWRRVRRRKSIPIDSAVLTVIRDPGSKSLIPVEELVKEKLTNLSDRESTDESWSGSASNLFERVSGYSSDDEDDHRESDAYMQLMKHGDRDHGDEPGPDGPSEMSMINDPTN